MSIKKKYRVEVITFGQSKEWLLYKHYAKRIPPVEFAFGLFNEQKILCGCITYGTPSSSPLRGIFNNEFKLIELNRLVIDEDTDKNCLSFLVSKSLQMLPNPLVVISYADTSQGHHGYIYQATNFIYTGLSAKRTDWKIKGMEHLHGTTIADLSKGKDNRGKFMRDTYGDDFYLGERPRKHRYFMFLGNKYQIKRMKEILPYSIESYPKGENKRYDSSYKPNVQLKMF